MTARGEQRRDLAHGVACWLGISPGEELGSSVAVLSPHLDDAAFSLGAAIAAASERSAAVSIVTVFAGDPDSSASAGSWDSRAGFRTAGEAIRRRREEDAVACRDLGAQPVWLPHPDSQYESVDDTALWASVERAVAGVETVLLPGFPLMHEDHRRLLALVESHGLPRRRVGHYVEQPYAAAWSSKRLGDGWSPAAAALRHRRTKVRACRRYESQLPLLQRRGRIFWPLLRYEAVHGGELIRWL